jgi:hypothetical protein
MTSVNLDHNNELLGARKNRRMDWVTPRLTLMGTEGLKADSTSERNISGTGPS